MSSHRRCSVRQSLTVLAPERTRPPVPFAPRRPGPCALCADGPIRDAKMLGRRNLAFACPVGRPALRVEASSDPWSLAPFAQRDGLGANEVVVLDPRHDTPLSAAAWADGLLLARDRLRDLRQDRRLRGFGLVASRGVESGATLDHPHLQLFASAEPNPTTPEPREADACPSCALFTADARRVITRSATAVAICPWAPQVDFETWIAPMAHLGELESSPDEVICAVAAELARVMEAIDRALGTPPWTLRLRAAAPGRPGHWRLELRPHLGPPSPIEQALGMHLCTVAPEDAAEHLRRVLADPATLR